MDALEDPERYKAFEAYVKEKGIPVFPISAAGRQGIEALLQETARMLGELRKEPAGEEPVYYMPQDEQEDPLYRQIQVEKDGDVFVLSGGQLYKIFDSTNFNDMESLRYLYRYIEEKGAMDKMVEMGIKEGDTVRIKNFEFDYFD